MGFSENGSKRACVAVNNANADVAMNWVFAHMEDPDFNSPLPQGGSSSSDKQGLILPCLIAPADSCVFRI